MLLLEVVEATFEPLLVTMMLELDEVNSATEPASSRRVPTMDVKGLPDSCCNCLKTAGLCVHLVAFPVIKSMRVFLPSTFKQLLMASFSDTLPHGTFPT